MNMNTNSVNIIQSAVIEDDDANKFRSKVLKPMKIIDVVKIVLIAVGGAVLLICIALAIAFVVKKRKVIKFIIDDAKFVVTILIKFRNMVYENFRSRICKIGNGSALWPPLLLIV